MGNLGRWELGLKFATAFFALPAFLLVSASAWAQGDRGLIGEYYNNPGTSAAAPPPPPESPFGTTFTGSPALTRIDPVVQFTWGSGSPGPGVSVDDFMIAWTGQLLSGAAGTYRFGTRADDGSRIWLAGQTVFNNWVDQGPPAAPQMGTTVTLTANTSYEIRVEFYENGGGAVAELHWQPPGASAASVIPATNLRLPPPPPEPALSGGATTDPLTAAARVDLSWTPSTGAEFYRVKRSNTLGGPYQVIDPDVRSTTFADRTVQYDVQYAYVVTAVKKTFLESANSNEVVALPKRPPPRTNDHQEGLINDRCSMGSVATWEGSGFGPAIGWLLAALVLGVGARGRFRRRERPTKRAPLCERGGTG